MFTVSFKGSTLWFLFGISEFPASLLLFFGAIIKENKSYLTLIGLWYYESQSDKSRGLLRNYGIYWTKA